MNLTEADDIKKRCQEYTEELYKKDLHDPDNQDGVILTSTRGSRLKQLLLHQILQRLNFSVLRRPHILPATRKC